MQLGSRGRSLSVGLPSTAGSRGGKSMHACILVREHPLTDYVSCSSVQSTHYRARTWRGLHKPTYSLAVLTSPTRAHLRNPRSGWSLAGSCALGYVCKHARLGAFRRARRGRGEFHSGTSGSISLKGSALSHGYGQAIMRRTNIQARDILNLQESVYGVR